MQELTGAQALVRSLEAAGRRGSLRAARRHDPADLRPAAVVVAAARTGPARAGRRPRGRGLRLGDRPARRVHGDQRPRRDQPGHRAVRRLHGLGADGGHHRPGRHQPDRHRRVPGSRHHRHHAADHQAQRARDRAWSGSRRRWPRRSTSPPPAGRARCSSTCPRTSSRPPGRGGWPMASGRRPWTCPATGCRARRAQAAIEAAAALLLPGPPAGAVRRRRRGQVRLARRAAPAGRAGPGAGDHHADGPRRVPRHPPAGARHAGHARHLPGGRRAAGGRPAGRARRRGSTTGSPASWPHFAPRARIVHADIDPAEIGKNRHAGRGDPGDLRLTHGRAGRGARGGARARTARRTPRTGWPRPGRLEAAVPAALHPGARRPAEAAVRDRAAVRADRRRRHRGGRRRPAPDARVPALLLHQAAQLDQLRRRGHDGLRGPGRDGRPGGPAGRDWWSRSTATAASR